eukprot:369846-Lingulodinium_polyedra.AAC.1
MYTYVAQIGRAPTFSPITHVFQDPRRDLAKRFRSRREMLGNRTINIILKEETTVTRAGVDDRE